ncbi:MAG TPA: asparagine synthase C-terminal domain-containing protein [Solirubrobacterales bacterium]
MNQDGHLRRLIREAVEAAVEKAAGPACVMLSGGIDSSTVASFATELPLVTGWYDAKGFDEREYARLVADGREWLEVEITPDDLVECAGAAVKALQGLRCGPGAIGQYVVDRAIADEGFQTILTGEGGDELFGGYARQLIVAGFPRPPGYETMRLPAGYPATLEAALEVEWAALRQLCKVDERVAGAHGLTVTPPLLDPWLVGWVHTRPADERIWKRLLRSAMRGTVPDRILDRQGKQGFPAPFVAWAQEDPVRGFLEERIGYVPDPREPYSRQWWYDLQDSYQPALAISTEFAQ